MHIEKKSPPWRREKKRGPEREFFHNPWLDLRIPSGHVSYMSALLIINTPSDHTFDFEDIFDPLEPHSRLIVNQVLDHSGSYTLPLERQFGYDHIFTHSISPGIDSSKFLTQMVGLLRENGEVRIGLLELNAIAKLEGNLELLNGSMRHRKGRQQPDFREAKGMAVAFSVLSSQKDVTTYVILDGASKVASTREMSGYQAGLMIIKKGKSEGDNIPKFVQNRGSDGKYPFVGGIYRVDMNNPVQDPTYNNMKHYDLVACNS